LFLIGWFQCALFISIFLVNMGYIIGEQISDWKEYLLKLWEKLRGKK
jgi:hypothetical protein